MTSIIYNAGSHLSRARLLLRLRRERFDGLICLMRIARRGRRLLRDKLYFKLAGIKRFFCAQGWLVAHDVSEGAALPRLTHVTDIFFEQACRLRHGCVAGGERQGPTANRRT